jgi:ferrochelatase
VGKPADTLAVVVLNLGGPDGPESVEPFLRNLFADPDVIQLGWLRPLQPIVARVIARRRAPTSRAAYSQIGGRSPILADSSEQAKAIAGELERRGHATLPFVAMACWKPLSTDAVAAMRAGGIQRAIAVPLYPQYSGTTTGSAFKALDRAIAGTSIQVARVEHYPDATGYIEALGDRISEAIAALPAAYRAMAPIVFSAHGLPESYIRRGDPYLDEIRTTVTAVVRDLERRGSLGMSGRQHLAFQSRLGRQRWLGPSTEQTLDTLADAGHRAVVVCPVSFTGEHLETLQEIDILYREHARKRGIVHFARARTVGCHTAFIRALADLAEAAARAQGWA